MQRPSATAASPPALALATLRSGFVWSRRAALLLLALLWTVVALLSLAELTAADTHTTPRDWVFLTWTLAALVLLSAVLLAWKSVSLPRSHVPWWNAVGLNWLLYAFASTLVASLFAQFASHYGEAELRLLQQRAWHDDGLPTGLRMLTVVHWLQLHLLTVASWLVVFASALFAEGHALLPPS